MIKDGRKPTKSATDTFGTEGSQIIINELRKRHSSLDTVEIQAEVSFLARKHRHNVNEGKLSKFRHLAVALSMTLSDRGIAPRFQNMFSAYEDLERGDALKYDGVVMDLYFLSKEFPTHKPALERWCPVFGKPTDIPLMASIADRQKKVSFKIENLNLSTFQQQACAVLHGNPAKLARKRAHRARTNFKDRKTTPTCRNKTNAYIMNDYHADILYCAKLVNCSPTKTAQIYKWMSGVNKSTNSIARTIGRLKIVRTNDKR